MAGTGSQAFQINISPTKSKVWLAMTGLFFFQDKSMSNLGSSFVLYSVLCYIHLIADSCCLGYWCSQVISSHDDKNIERQTAHTIVSWPNPKQWIIVHTSHLMMVLCNISFLWSLPYVRKILSYLNHLNFDQSSKMQLCCYISSNKFSIARINVTCQIQLLHF